MKRLNPSLFSSLSTVAVLVVLGAVLSVVSIGRDGAGGGGTVEALAPAATEDEPLAGDAMAPEGDVAGPGSVAGTAGGQAGSGAATGTKGAAKGGPAAAGRGLECATGKNGGATDVGVTGNSVKLGATVVLDGPGASFLAPVRVAMNAVVKKVNNAGGICGRRLNLILRNDSWDATTGRQFIRNFVEGEKVFGMAVVPSSEGLRAADGYIREQGVPVVGTDGMLEHQYHNPWIWPVATPTTSTMHVMALDAYQRAKGDTNSSSFGIVFDAKYHFGVEGAFAFNQAVKRLTGKDIAGYDPKDPKGSLKRCVERFCGIQPNQPSYTTQVSDFNAYCGMGNGRSSDGQRCAFVALLLEPDTAVTWMQAGRQGDPDPVGYGGAQPLFNRNFAVRCASHCARGTVRIWTGYNPPIDALAALPDVSRFVRDLKAESSQIDVTNQFVEGGYYGMELLVQALKEVGPNLTRQSLRARLDSMTFTTDFSKPLTWRPGDHFANTSARAFEIQYQNGFNGFRAVTEFIDDPWAGQDGIETD